MRGSVAIMSTALAMTEGPTGVKSTDEAEKAIAVKSKA
jgi:hypothetical protein